MMDISNIYRLRAVASEQRAGEASDHATKSEWAEIAIQWHFMANVAAEVGAQIRPDDLDVA